MSEALTRKDMADEPADPESYAAWRREVVECRICWKWEDGRVENGSWSNRARYDVEGEAENLRSEYPKMEHWVEYK